MTTSPGCTPAFSAGLPDVTSVTTVPLASFILKLFARSSSTGMIWTPNQPRTMKGVVVVEVEVGEAAEKAGLQRGDVIVSVDDKAVGDVDEFESEIARAQKDGIARLRVRRGSGFIFIVLKF